MQLAPNGRARSVSTFADGFAHPLALLVDRSGGLLVADWGPGVVYRIQARSRLPARLSKAFGVGRRSPRASHGTLSGPAPVL